jgi:hypothetical protein
MLKSGFFLARMFSNGVFSLSDPVVIPEVPQVGDTSGRYGFDRGVGGVGSSSATGAPIQPLP